MKQLLEEILNDCFHYTKEGTLAQYIPELAKANPNDFGIYIISKEHTDFAGDYVKTFTIQSVVKPLILLLALEDNGIAFVNKCCGVEATGKPFDAFNYSDRALQSDYINPMINAGAITLCTLVHGKTYEEKFSRLLAFAGRLSGNQTLTVDEKVYLSQNTTGNKNRALAYMLKAYGVIDGDIEEILDMYFKACSIKVSCVELANIAFILANYGFSSFENQSIIRKEHARYVNVIMTTCGMYDGSGEFALKVGIPAKSGVGGGIMAVAPNRMGIGLYSPALDPKGNSLAGIKALEILSSKLDLSIF